MSVQIQDQHTRPLNLDPHDWNGGSSRRFVPANGKDRSDGRWFELTPPVVDARPAGADYLRCELLIPFNITSETPTSGRKPRILLLPGCFDASLERISEGREAFELCVGTGGRAVASTGDGSFELFATREGLYLGIRSAGLLAELERLKRKVSVGFTIARSECVGAVDGFVEWVQVAVISSLTLVKHHTPNTATCNATRERRFVVSPCPVTHTEDDAMQTTLKTADAKPAYEAPSFTDTKGRVWSLDFTLGTFRVLSKEVGLDLSKVLEDGQALVGFLFAPAGVRGNALWLVVRKQAEAVGVTEDEFFDSLDAEAMRAGCEAVLLAVADYYPRKVYGNAVRENLPKVLETLDAAIASKTPATLERLAETPAA